MKDSVWLDRYNVVVRERDQLRAQLAQRTAAIQEHLRQHDHQLNGDPDCMCVVCEILQPLRNALADLSDVPRVEP